MGEAQGYGARAGERHVIKMEKCIRNRQAIEEANDRFSLFSFVCLLVCLFFRS